MNTTGESPEIGVSYRVNHTNPSTNSGLPTRTTSTTLPSTKLHQRPVPQAQTQTHSRLRTAATHSNSQPVSLTANGSGSVFTLSGQTKMSYSAIILVFVFTAIVYYLLSTDQVDTFLKKIVDNPSGFVGTLIKAVVLGVVVIISIKIGGA